jgi:hypothetical protein
VVSKEDKQYAIHSIEDFSSAKFEQLLELAERALSGPEPSIHKLANPISEDPKLSIHKQARGYISPDKISYTQTSYR